MAEHILFLCTGNSARSILAEAIANQQFAPRLEATSAGSKPKDGPHPLTLQTISQNGMSTEGLRSKSWHELQDESFDLVITLCGSAQQEPCPAFPGAPEQVHWPLPDPPAAEHPEDMFQAVYEVRVESIGYLANGPDPTMAARAKAAGREISRRFSPSAV
jgi:arsenate reductase